MAKHKGFTVATDVQVFFCDPQSRWQARHQRKHQLAVTAVLPARHRPVWLFASAAGPGRAALESTPAKAFRFPDSCELTARKCCVDRLSRHDLPGKWNYFPRMC
jgi:hypothetical protein